MRSSLKVLMIGDVVGVTGRMMFQKHIRNIREQYKVDAVIVNGENSNNNGRGITGKIAEFFKHNGANVITTGNHVWDQSDIIEYMRSNNDVIRPANFPTSCPGLGYTTFLIDGALVAVVNVQGRVFMKESLDCPFLSLDTILSFLKHKTNIILVEVHAEATAEKVCLAYYVDGRVSAVVGTHTHVPTADERVLPNGTGYVTDLGMTGALNSSIGMKKEAVIERFKNQMPCKFFVDTQPPMVMTGVVVEIDTKTGKALHIERIKVIDEDIRVIE